MAFTARKITDGDIATYGVQSQPNKLTGSAADNKKGFDKLIEQVVQEKLNGLIDDSDTPFIFEKIGARLQHIMIDEFQDTGALQWNNFKILLNECMGQATSSSAT